MKTGRIQFSTTQTHVSSMWVWVSITGVIGLFLGIANNWLPLHHDAETPIRMPALWRIPKYPGMGTLRLAMLSDVIHERYAIRSPAWYAAHNTVSRARIETWATFGGDPSTDVLDAFDDLAVGLDKVGDDKGAVSVMKQKAAAIHLQVPEHRATRIAVPNQVTATVPETQDGPGDRDRGATRRSLWDLRHEVETLSEAELAVVKGRGELSPADHHHYTTLANLGTALIHGHIRSALADQEEAAHLVEQGLACLDAAVAVNPAAHFGREAWQVIVVEHLLAARTQPELLMAFDAVGDPLPPRLAPNMGSPYDNGQHQPSVRMWPWQYIHSGMPSDLSAQHRVTSTTNRLFGPDWTPEFLDQHIDDFSRCMTRSYLTIVGADEAWVGTVHPSRKLGAAFDEPLLGLMGMWTWGGGPNPHFALAIATICERIGQRPLAIDAYERCAEMADRFSPEPQIRERLVQYCHARQEVVAESIASSDPRRWLDEERARHAAELAWALSRRKAAQAVEAGELAKGVAPDRIPLGDGDPHPLASPTGTADERWGVRDRSEIHGDGLACALIASAGTAWLVIGLRAIVGVILSRRRGRLEANNK